jgi:hypothetical protein
MIGPDNGWFESVKATNKSATSIQDLFHNTWLAPYLQPQFIVFDKIGMQANSNLSSNKFVNKTIMAFNPTQLQVTTINPQANAIIERVHKINSSQLHAQII